MRFHKLQGSAARIAVVLAALAPIGACATDGLYTGGDAGGRVGAAHFNQVGRTPVAPPPPVAVASAQTRPGLSLNEARRRVEAYLSQAGFEPESVATGGLYTISGERMATADQVGSAKTEAACGLKALERPQMYMTHVDVRLSPAQGSEAGVQLGIEVKIVEMDANLLSGAFSKQTCRSRGVLEAALRRAARGG
jgi:hypothetical protein